jgi:GT2 family glycosyltransferase
LVGAHADEAGAIVATSPRASALTALAAGRLQVTGPDDLADVKAVRLIVTASADEAHDCRSHGLPVVALSGDEGVDAERIAWMLDAPKAIPGDLAARARIAAARAAVAAAQRRPRPLRVAQQLLEAVRPHRRVDDLPWAVGRSPWGPRAVLSRPMTPVPRVTVIMPTCDQPELLTQALEGLATTAWPDLEVVIVDNGSSDPEALEILGRTRHRVERVPIDFNFPRLVNRGAAVALGDVLVFLNNDVKIGRPDWLAPLTACVAGHSVGPVGCLLSYPDGRVQHCGMALSARGPTHPFRGALRSDVPATALASGERSGVTGACLAIRTDVFWKLGGFDPLLKRDFNDIDLCLRSWTDGYRVLFTRDTELIHFESLSRETGTHPDTVADWFVFRNRWADVLARPDRWWPQSQP